MTIEAKNAQIDDLQLEVRAKDALLDAQKNGIDLNEVALYDTYDSQNFLSPSSKRRLQIDLKHCYQTEDVDGQENISEEESREEELKQCEGEILRMPGNREKSIVDMNSEMTMTMPGFRNEEYDFKPHECEFFERVTTTEACEIFEGDSNENEYFDAEDTSNMNQICSSLVPKERLGTENEKRASPEEEFFRLSCLAMKIRISERQDHAQDTEGDQFDVFTISESKLFKLCQKKKIPFHSYHEWIKDQFDRVMEL